MMGQLGAQEQGPQGKRSAGGNGPQEVWPVGAGCYIITGCGSQVAHAVGHMPIFLGTVKSREHSTQEKGESSNTMEFETQDTLLPPLTPCCPPSRCADHSPHCPPYQKSSHCCSTTVPDPRPASPLPTSADKSGTN